MEVNFKILHFLNENQNNSEIELDKIYKGIINKDKTEISFIDSSSKKHIFKIGDDCGIVPNSEKNILPGVKYIIDHVFYILPEQVKSILENFNLDDGIDGYEKCRNLNKQLEKLGYYCDYGLDAIPFSIVKEKPLKNKLKL